MAGRTVEVTGGEKMAKKLAAIIHRLGNGAELSVGFIAGATYPAKADGKGGLSVAQVAFWNEFGTKRSPPRPFMRSTVAAKSPGWGRALGLAALNNQYDAKGTLTAMGHGIKDQIVEAIIAFTDPPNAPYTVEKKGFNKPLIDTAHMSRSVDFEVVVK